jgi:hypothetical protein
MFELQPLANSSFDHDLTAVDRSMVGTAQRNEIVRMVVPPVGLTVDVMHIDERAVPTSREGTTMAVPAQH